MSLPFAPEEGAEGFVEELGSLLSADDHPYLVEMVTEQVVG